MNYYKVLESINLKEIGSYPQSISEVKLQVINPVHDLIHFIGKKIEQPYIIPEPILRPKSKPTDLISCVTIGLNLVVSDFLKEILIAYNSTDMQYVEISAKFNSKKIRYWIVHPMVFNLPIINFKDSEIWRIGLGAGKLHRENVDSLESFNNLKARIELPESLSITKPSIQQDAGIDFFALSPVYGGIGFYVSEKLKEKITEELCSGIRFEKMSE